MIRLQRTETLTGCTRNRSLNDSIQEQRAIAGGNVRRGNGPGGREGAVRSLPQASRVTDDGVGLHREQRSLPEQEAQDKGRRREPWNVSASRSSVTYPLCPAHALLAKLDPMQQNVRDYLHAGLLGATPVLVIVGVVMFWRASAFEGYIGALIVLTLAACSFLGARELKPTLRADMQALF